MSEIDTGGPAFPRPFSRDTFNDEECPSSRGMTLRDYFAAKAMQAIIDSDYHFDIKNLLVVDAVAEMSYNYADAMLKARDK